MNQIGGADKVRLLNILMQLRKVTSPLGRHPVTWHTLPRAVCAKCPLSYRLAPCGWVAIPRLATLKACARVMCVVLCQLPCCG